MSLNQGISKTPCVSIVITTYQRDTLVQRAVKSVLLQTYPLVEIIVVEDGSNGGIEGWIDAQHLGNVRYKQHAENLGLAAARNTGLHNASGQYVAFLDDDDQWFPEKLQKQVELAESLGSQYQIIYCGTLTETIEGQVVRIPKLKGEIYQMMMSGWTPPQSACLFRTQSLRQLGGFDENLFSGIDHDIWMQCAVAGYQADFIDEALVVVGAQDTPNRMTLNTDQRIKGIKDFLSKWQSEIAKAIGKKGYQCFYRHYLSREYEKFGMFELQNGRHLPAVLNLFLAIWYNFALPRLYYKFFLTLIGSRQFYLFIKRIYYKNIMGGKRQMDISGIPGLSRHLNQDTNK